MAKFTTVARVGACGRGRINKEHQPEIWVKEGVAHYTNVRHCGSIHLCPVCSPRIRQRRAEEIDAAALWWLTHYGNGSMLFLTLTMPHDYGERLRELLTTVGQSLSAVLSGRNWQRIKSTFGLAHYIVAYDVTVGGHGWHPHLHLLLFGTRGLGALELELLQAEVYKNWTKAITRRGHRPPSYEHGVMLEVARSRKDVSRYVAQLVAGDDDDSKTRPVALEMARGDLKRSWRDGHRTHWQVLYELTERRKARGEWTAADDRADDRDAVLWREWEKASKGLKAIRWSRKLRVTVGLAKEKTDEEIVAEKVGGDLTYKFGDDHSWRAVAETPGGRAQVLRGAERAGAVGARAAVDELYRHWRKRRDLKLLREFSRENQPIVRAAGA